MEGDDIKARWEEMVARLKRERDELALKIHLGRKDLTAEWERLEAQWKRIVEVKGPPMKEAASEAAGFCCWVLRQLRIVGLLAGPRPPGGAPQDRLRRPGAPLKRPI